MYYIYIVSTQTTYLTRPDVVVFLECICNAICG